MMRQLHKLWADFFGYFWIPCPLCGESFGGHEVPDDFLFIRRYKELKGLTICPKCNRAVRRIKNPGTIPLDGCSIQISIIPGNKSRKKLK